jgi:N-acetyl-alpha-D-muramate 1-phosphate uridylyltransferase
MSDRPRAVMMFAAGFGTRMGALTRDRPKPLIPVAGVPLIDHTLRLIQEAGVPRVVANLHYLPEMLKAHLNGTEVETITETPEILETGGGLRNALPLLGPGPVFTTNTDAIWAGPNPLTLLAEAWEPAHMDALLVTVPPTQAVGHGGKGDFVADGDGRLTRGPGMTYGGVQIIRTDLLGGIEDRAFSLNLVWDRMLAEGRLYGLTYPGQWCDVGHPDGIALAEDMLAARHV